MPDLTPTELSGLNETQLMDRAAAGDKQAFALLQQRCAGLVIWVIRAYDVLDPADLAQEVWVTVWEKRRGWKTGRPDGFNTWLVTVTRRKCIDANRKREPLPPPPPPGPDDPEAAVVADAVKEHLLGLLDERSQKVIALVCFYYVSREEAAAMLGLKYSNLVQLLSRARKTLKEHLPGCHTCEGYQ